MDLEKTHPQYRQMLPLWERCRDFMRGEDAVKRNAYSNGYLPMPDGMEEWAYSAYVSRASVPGIFESTVNGRLGDIFRKPPILEGPDNLIDWSANVTFYNEPLDIFTQQVLKELMITGRCAIVLDFSGDFDRHILTLYQAEDILNWEETANNKRLRLRERSYDPEGMGGVTESFLDLRMTEGRFEATRSTVGVNGIVEDEATPTKAGGALDFFPAIVVNTNGLRFDVNDPPMINLTNLLLSIFRNSADYEQGLHCLGVPTPVISGIRKEDAQFTLGPYTPILMEPPEARAYYLEFNGAGIGHLKESIEEKLLQALMLGARIMQPRRAVESAEAAKTRMGAETSILNTLCRVAEDSVQQAARFWAMWQGLERQIEDIEYHLNRDFIEEQFDPNVLRVINESEASGLISPQTCFQLRKKFEIYPSTLTFEEEQDLLQTANPLGGLES